MILIKNKKILLTISLLIILSIILVVIFNYNGSNEKNIISNINKDKQVINSNMITMMYETDAGSGIYEETKDNIWPEAGYIFNDTLSGCENGGELEYNSQNNTVNLLSNKSDKCYVYFDKYNGVWIDNVVATNITGSSITLDVSATSENGNIAKYYYKVNDGEYTESTSNIITINDLNKLTEYKISIYTIDNTNAKSNLYEINVNTIDESGPIITNVIASNIESTNVTLTINVESQNKIKNYYYTIEESSLAGTSSSNTLNVNNLNSNTSYSILTFVEDENGLYSEKYQIKVTTKKANYFADYIKSLYTSQGSNGLYYHTSSLANSAADNSYRYAGSNPNNYVCFGSDASTCPSDNLYRIIGVFGSEVKLIKSSSYGSYAWNSSEDSDWILSDIRSRLNVNFLNSVDEKWRNKISIHTWYVGGGYSFFLTDNTPKNAYDYEVGANNNGKTDNIMIGLMYVSDYYYGASPTYWTYEGYNWGENDYSLVTENWLRQNAFEWTISPILDSNVAHAALIWSDGSVRQDGWGLSSLYSIRPCLYLKSDVIYISGNGTSSNPYRIN